MAETNKTNSNRRPSAKEFLKLAENESRGKLKVLLGMAPGVGKTYAMLAAARALKADGIDAVVGVVETHGRSETAALLDGLEVLPRTSVEYRQRTLMEFDVEAAIARRPQCCWSTSSRIPMHLGCYTSSTTRTLRRFSETASTSGRR